MTAYLYDGDLDAILGEHHHADQPRPACSSTTTAPSLTGSLASSPPASSTA
ncbi:hypothetical protein GS928_24915 [Rhodococcus hoagii]|nr:hypothetical protein [Prescottella equi]